LWCNCGPMLHEFHHQHSFPVPENSFQQLSGRQHLFKLLRLVSWTCVHSLLCLLFGFNIHNWNPRFITCYSYNVVEKFIAIFAVSLLKILQKPKPFCTLCANLSVCIRPPLWSSGQSSWLQIQMSRVWFQAVLNFLRSSGLKRGPLSLMRIIEELLERKVAAPV
jgi:hypothetical protein